jgi:hypothetical protein
MLGSICRDPAVSVRKEMVHIISGLLQQYPDDKELSKIWAKCVVPLVLDQEVKLQESVLKVSTTEWKVISWLTVFFVTFIRLDLYLQVNLYTASYLH